MGMLLAQAAIAAYAFYKPDADEILLAPANAPRLDPQLKVHLRHGFALAGVVAMLRKQSAEGRALIQCELWPHVAEDTAGQIRATFKDSLVESGVMHPSRTGQDHKL